MPLFEVALLELPTKKDAEENQAIEKLVLPPIFVIASNEQNAGIQAIRDNNDKVPKDLTRIQVLVRPFA